MRVLNSFDAQSAMICKSQQIVSDLLIMAHNLIFTAFSISRNCIMSTDITILVSYILVYWNYVTDAKHVT
jgi:hypothetical protein